MGVRATIERAVREGMPLIIEGIHLLPGLVDLDAVSDRLVVYVVLTVDDEDDHLASVRGPRGSLGAAGRAL